MPIISEALEYFIEEKPDITQNFLSALSLSRQMLDNCLLQDDSLILDFHICHALYIITSICETIKTTYSHYAAAEEIRLSANLKNITLNQLRNYLYHDFLIPDNREQKLALKDELSDLLYHFKCSLDKDISPDTFSNNIFLKKIDAILLERHAFNHFGGRNIFLRARNIPELCASFPTDIYAIKALRTPKVNSAAQQKALNLVIFDEPTGYLSLLNSLEKSNKNFEQPLEISAFSQHLRKCISEQLSLWAGEFFQKAEKLSKIPGKSSPDLEKSCSKLCTLSECQPDFQKNKFSEISDFLLNNINEATSNIKYFGPSFKIKAYLQIINVIQQERKYLTEVLGENTNEIDQPLIKYYVFHFDYLFSTIDDIQENFLEAEHEKNRKEIYYRTELEKAIITLYRTDTEGYTKFIQYLTHAIALQPSSYMPPFLKKCADLIITLEDNDHADQTNLTREAFLSEINENYSRIMVFLRIFRDFTKNSTPFNDSQIPFFGCEMYLIVCMNTCLKMIENIERLSEDPQIQEHIAYIRLELNMRSHQEIENLDPQALHFFELISSYSGIGKSIANFRHYSISLDPKIKENIQWLYAAFSSETPYRSPENADMSNFTDLFKAQTEKVKSATGFNKARKIMTLCFDRLVSYRLNMLVSQQVEEEIVKIDDPNITAGSCTQKTTVTVEAQAGTCLEVEGHLEQKFPSKRRIKVG